MTGSASVSSGASDIFDVTPAILIGRKYLAVRAIHGEEGEQTYDAQKRIVDEFYGSVDEDVALD